jgi:hypothetical protein
VETPSAVTNAFNGAVCRNKRQKIRVFINWDRLPKKVKSIDVFGSVLTPNPPTGSSLLVPDPTSLASAVIGLCCFAPLSVFGRRRTKQL